MKKLLVPNKKSDSERLQVSSYESVTTELLAEANHCVACGLCLPRCPTYHLTLSEADSPRGRIALMSGVASNHIPLNDRFVEHMDRCLTCRACEAACPNSVAYGRLIDGARVMIRASSAATTEKEKNQSKKDWLRRTLERGLITKPSRLDALRPVMRLMVKSSVLERLLRLSVFSKNALMQSQLFLTVRNLPGHRWRPLYLAQGPIRGEVALFIGCVSRLIDMETLLSTIFVLTRLGYTVHVPRQQTCCGALYQHAGRIDETEALVDHNRKAFAGLNIAAIISTASGCGTQLSENLVSSSSTEWAVPVMDINQFLAEQDWSGIKLFPLKQKVVVHEPCTLRNVLQASEYLYPLLEQIPELEVVRLAGNDQCCGAAGTYFLDQPAFAQSLLNDKLRAIELSGADYLATANVGCALHIANGLIKAGRNIEVLHPVTLLARQMRIQ